MCEVWSEVSRVLWLVKVFLSLTVVPAQTLVQGGKPVGYLVLSTDGWHGVNGGGDSQAVMVVEGK